MKDGVPLYTSCRATSAVLLRSSCLGASIRSSENPWGALQQPEILAEKLSSQRTQRGDLKSPTGSGFKKPDGLGSAGCCRKIDQRRQRYLGTGIAIGHVLR